MMSDALHGLLEVTRASPDEASVARSVAAFVEAWSVSALAMIDIAAAAGAASSPGAPQTQVGQPMARAGELSSAGVRGAIQTALACIVDATRAGTPGVEAACSQFADTYATALLDAAASAALHTSNAYEQQFGISSGTAH